MFLIIILLSDLTYVLTEVYIIYKIKDIKISLVVYINKNLN